VNKKEARSDLWRTDQLLPQIFLRVSVTASTAMNELGGERESWRKEGRVLEADSPTPLIADWAPRSFVDARFTDFQNYRQTYCRHPNY
jgi:hypothetical protein